MIRLSSDKFQFKYFGSAPTTSASPPTFAAGKHSKLICNTFIGNCL